jgi:hypothetical protein
MIVPDESRATADQAALDSQTEEARKIFTIIDRDKTLAYAVTGFARLGKFHAWEEIRRKISLGSSEEFDSCKKYMTALCDGLVNDLNRAVADKTMGPLPSGVYKTEVGNTWKILDIFTAGYFKGKPSLVVSQIFHSDGIHADFDVNHYDPQSRVLSGSEVVRKAMYPEQGEAADPRFSAYTKQLTDSSSLRDAEDYVKGYIAACSSDLAREIDYEKWKIIGGRTHLAKVTLSNGFEWVTPPKRL